MACRSLLLIVVLRWEMKNIGPSESPYEGGFAHGCDLVQATGVVAELPDDLAEEALTFARAELPSQSRTGRFPDPQPIVDKAPTIDRLAAFTGRPVPWTP